MRNQFESRVTTACVTQDKKTSEPAKVVRHRVSLLMLCLILLLILLLIIGVAITRIDIAKASSPTLQPTLNVVEYAHAFDASNCATVTLSGKGFSRPGFTPTSVSLQPAHPITGISITPTQVSPGFDGNFDTKATICYVYGLVDRLTSLKDFQIIASDNNTGTMVTSRKFTIQDPTPVIRVVPTYVKLLAGCATVKIFGHDFLPSNLTTSYAAISASDTSSTTYYTVTPNRVNVLINGNIAISIQICGLVHSQDFSMTVHDTSSLLKSNTETIHTR